MREVNIDKLRRLQKQLQRKFDLVYPIDDEKSFFIGIADYVEAINQSDYMTAIIKTSIIPARIKLDSEIDSITNKSIKETKKVFGRLFNLMVEKKIDNTNILAEFNEYHSLLDGTTQISGDSGNSATHLSDKVRDILIAFKYNGYDDIAKQYEILDEHGNNRGWKISPSEAEVEKKLLERKDKMETSIWGAWNDLYWAFATIHERYDIWDSMIKNGKLWDRLNFSGLIEEWKKILEDKLQPQDRRIFFKKDRFKSHIARVHDKIDNEIDSLADAAERIKAKKQPEEGKQTESQEKWYAPESGAGFIKGKNFNLTEGKDKYKLFNRLVTAKKLSRPEVISILELPNEQGDKTNRSLNTYKINEVVKELRKTTRLDKTEIINNGGNITLLAELEIKSPNIT
jgi:hypothetical protein